MADQADLAAELLARAQDDLAAARALLDVGTVSDAIVGFHAQQAVEKALKAVLSGQGIGFRLSHDLDYLTELCQEAGLELPGELDEVERLTPFAVIGRYGAPSPPPVDRATALRWAASAVAWADSA